VIIATHDLGLIRQIDAPVYRLANGMLVHESGEAAPRLARMSSTTFDGDPFVLSRRKGSWVVLNFFNSTCVPCKREHPELVKFAEGQEELGAQGAELYTIVNDDSEEAVRAFFDEFGGEWPIVRDDDARIAVDYGIAKVPETWLISPTGVVAQRFTGQVTAELLGTAIASMSGSR
jgi:cytochrome c biogenesis protein CcmG/thiol:disulfide interchange protein DsbE